MGWLRKTIGRAFGYDAVEDKTHRRRVSVVVQSEDHELPAAKRQKLIGQTHDVRRNFEVAAWTVRKHLDFVATFTFRSTTGNAEWDRAVERFVREKSRPSAFDAAGRHSLRKAIRLAEALRTIGGDLGVLKLRDGRVQLVESDRIKNPPGRRDAERWCHGVKLNDAGGALAYAVWKRKGTGYVFDRDVASRRLYLHGYFDRYDQVRGISPLAAALNRFRDVYENIDYALAKTKVTNLIGLAVFRKPPMDDDEDEDTSDDDEEDCPDDDLKLDPDKGPFTFNGLTGEDAKILEANHPGVAFLDFTKVAISIALKALDIPFSFFDESYTNFFGQKTALTLYLKSVEDKRQDNRDLLDHWTRWRLGLAIANGEIDPAEYGLTWEDVDGAWRWIARGVPWFDKSREVKGDREAVELGVQTVGDVIEERLGEDFFETVDRAAKEREYAASKGVPYGVMPTAAPGVAGEIEAAIGKAEEDAEAEK